MTQKITVEVPDDFTKRQAERLTKRLDTFVAVEAARMESDPTR